VVSRTLADFGLPATALDLELTEHTILRSDSRMLADLHALRAHGVGIVLDHFGTGHASIAMLRDHPVTRIKIDRSLVSALGRSPGDVAILDGVARLGRGFGLAVTADGVETSEQAHLLRPHCSDAQGSYFGQRVPAEEFEVLHLTGSAAPPSQGSGIAPEACEWPASLRRAVCES
jgi:EAL domain-containing protein (putative c-di-GMP-specific phosphodiesterase class I)